MFSGKRGLKVTINAPVVIGFVALCVAATLINALTGGAANRVLFTVRRGSLLNPLTYLRCVTHVIGHSGFDHLLGNMLYILILGPMLEEKYGKANMIFVILATALITGVLSVILFPHNALCGASGVVFSMILLSSITSVGEGELPLTFILVAALYLGQQVYQGLFIKDNVSQFAHILGGLVGAGLGFYMNRAGLTRYHKR